MTIPPRNYNFAPGDKVQWSWRNGCGMVVAKLPTGKLVVQEKSTQRIYHPDGVLEGRYVTNKDLNLFHADDSEDIA